MSLAETKTSKKPKTDAMVLTEWKKPGKPILYKVLVLPADGSLPIPQWLSKKQVTLEWMQKQVGGNIETGLAYDIELPDGSLVFICHEDAAYYHTTKVPKNPLIGEFLENSNTVLYGTCIVMPKACLM